MLWLSPTHRAELKQPAAGARAAHAPCCKMGSSSRFKTKGGVVSTTGWIILIVVLLILFGGGFGWSRRRR